MRKHKDLILFITITLIRSVFISMIKFFLRSYLKELNISLEEIMGYIALGCMFSYFVGGTLAYFFRKKHIIIVSMLVVIACLICGYFLGYYPFRVFTLLMGIIGFMYGIRLVIKSIILAIEIQKSEFGETSVNGIVNIAILGGTILGSYLGFTVYSSLGAQGSRVMLALLAVGIIATYFLGYDKHFVIQDVGKSIKTAIPSIVGVIKKYFRLLVPIGTLWAISAAVGQKMLEIGVDVFNKVPKSSIIIIIVSMIGAIVGHIISAFITKRKRRLSMIFTIFLGLITFYFPYILNKYDYYITLNISSFFMGVFFGMAVNLLEGRFFYHIGEDHRKEYGAAAYGIAMNIVIFLVMIISDVLTNRIGIIIPFIFFGTVLLLMPLFIRKFR